MACCTRNPRGPNPALISARPQNSLADEFLRESVFFDTKVLVHMDKGVPLDRFKVLVKSADLPKLSAEQKLRFDAFTAGGASSLGAERPNRELRIAPKPPPEELGLAWSRAVTCSPS